jgi:hypothetical protein
VFISLYGTLAKATRVLLRAKGVTLRQGKSSVYTLSSDIELGHVFKIRLESVGTSRADALFIDSVVVKHMARDSTVVWTFPVFDWLRLVSVAVFVLAGILYASMHVRKYPLCVFSHLVCTTATRSSTKRISLTRQYNQTGRRVRVVYFVLFISVVLLVCCYSSDVLTPFDVVTHNFNTSTNIFKHTHSYMHTCTIAYEIQVHTSNIRGAGTDADVSISLHSDTESSRPIKLMDKNAHKLHFQRGSVDTFNVQVRAMCRLDDDDDVVVVIVVAVVVVVRILKAFFYVNIDSRMRS